MRLGMLAWTGYWVGIGIELFVILICAALLALILTGVLFKWIAQNKTNTAVRAEVRAAEDEAREQAAEEAAALAEAEAAERAEREMYAREAAEAEAAARVAQAEEEPVEEEHVEEPEAVEEPVVEESEPVAVQEAAVAEEADETVNGDGEVIVVHDGIVFNESKTITELYEELSTEQQSFFDELREEALTKPDTELSIAKNFVTVKIGKRNLIKLLIKRGVTVAEFMLENEALKQLRLSNTNKRGKSSIKVKPTVVQVVDLPSLKVAVDMINLAYEEMMYND